MTADESGVPFLLGQLQAAVDRAKADRKAATEDADTCAACPLPDQTAALELVRLREGIRGLAEALDRPGMARGKDVADVLRALLDDNEGERS